jgi:hypothetical protein
MGTWLENLYALAFLATTKSIIIFGWIHAREARATVEWAIATFIFSETIAVRIAAISSIPALTTLGAALTTLSRAVAVGVAAVSSTLTTLSRAVGAAAFAAFSTLSRRAVVVGIALWM